MSNPIQNHTYEPPKMVGDKMPPEVAAEVFAGVGAPPCKRCGRPWQEHNHSRRDI